MIGVLCVTDKTKLDAIKAVVIDWLDFYDQEEPYDSEYTNGIMNSILAIADAPSASEAGRTDPAILTNGSAVINS